MESLRIGHSPDPDDAFMFYGFASEQVILPDHRIEHVLQDIQTLNEWAMGEDPLEVTALSVHGFLHVQDRYELLEVGTSVGRNYGPRLIANGDMALADLRGKRVALPGPYTTATLVARTLLPEIEEVHMDFTTIMEAVKSGDVAAG
ncbi:MAG: ABC transporter substrate-binding protein, partial [Candidatus Hydrogenedentes bacterium]|nr:ABC transporter substrate-binding protein [Candidatus Hydrogenedentota bacterium]